MSIVVPREFMVRNVAYRSLGSVQGERLGCGAIPKPNPERLLTRFIYDSFCAVYVLRGTGAYWREGKARIHLRPGDLLIRPPNRDHWTVPDADGEWHEFFFAAPIAYHQAFLGQGLIRVDRPVMNPGLSQGLLQRCQEMLQLMKSVRLRDNQEAIIEMQRFMLDAWEMDQRKGGHEPDAVERACELLRLETRDVISIATLASELGMTFESFRKLFSQRMGVSPAAYRNRHRMDRARMLLMNSEYPIAEIAAVVGYSDVYAFSKQFKRATGKAPRRFREASR